MEASKEESSDSLTNMSDSESTKAIRASLIAQLYETPLSEKRKKIEQHVMKLESEVAILKQAVSRVYENGWNEAMDKAAFDMETKFVSAFGKDTLSSIAIYLRSLKK